MTLEEFATPLRKKKWGKRKGLPKVIACCPAHDDKNASFAAWVGDDGWIHCKCQAGCSESSVLSALGYDQEARRTPDAVKPLDHKVKGEKVYRYFDDDGQYIFEKARKAGAKSFVQRITKEDGTVSFSLGALGEVSKTLYCMGEVNYAIAAGKRIWINEGEKACDALRAAGEVATCQPAGAGEGKWLEMHTRALAFADEIIIVADRDEQGEAYAASVAASLRREGRKITVVQSKTTNPKDDAYDHLEAGFSLEEFVPRQDLLYGQVLKLTEFKEEEFEEVEIDYWWEPYLPKGKLVLLDGDGGTGKSTFAIAVAASLSRGVLPNKQGRCEPVRTLYLHQGEDTDEELATVFRQNGGDFKYIKFYEGDFSFNAPGLQRLEATIRSGEFDLVFVDSLFYFLEGVVEDTNNRKGVLPVMKKLQKIAREAGCTIVNIRHTRKGSSKDEASDAGMGTVQFRNSHRGQLLVRYHPDFAAFPGVVVVTDEKGSILVPRGEPVAYRREHDRQRLEWVELEEHPWKAGKKLEGPKSRTESAKEYVRALVKNNPHVTRGTILDLAVRDGFSRRTADRAITQLGIKKGEDGNWRLLDE